MPKISKAELLIHYYYLMDFDQLGTNVDEEDIIDPFKSDYTSFQSRRQPHTYNPHKVCRRFRPLQQDYHPFKPSTSKVKKKYSEDIAVNGRNDAETAFKPPKVEVEAKEIPVAMEITMNKERKDAKTKPKNRKFHISQPLSQNSKANL